jgi:renalase
MVSDERSCIVVGAGMAGLTAATTLSEAGWRVMVLDKGRQVGGRTATRALAAGRADHGAQYFTVRDDRMQALVDRWLAAGAVRVWSHGFPTHDGDAPGGRYPRYCGVDGMTRMAGELAGPLDVHVSSRVTQVAADEGRWTLTVKRHGADTPETFTADALVMTPPAEQTLTLLAEVPLPDEVTTALARIEYNPCFALMARLDRPAAVPEPGGVFMPGEPISWLADNAQKGISDAPTLTIHAGPIFTREHYDDDPETVKALLLAAAADYLGEAEVLETQMLRWRYSQPTVMHPEKTLFTADPAPVAFAGDAFDGAKVEGAVLSGFAAADAIIAQVAR